MWLKDLRKHLTKDTTTVVYPLWVTLIIYCLLVFISLAASLIKTRWHFGYPLDDTYIHMAIGKHLAQDGYWGVSQYGFASSTSSPLWTFLIAITQKIFGTNDLIPFVLCLFAGIFVIYYCYCLLQKNLNPMELVFSLLFIVIITPLPILTLLGMEHILHSLFTICLLYSASTYLTINDFDFRQLSLILLLAGLVTIIRYEGLFLIFPIVLLFLAKRRFWTALCIGTAGLLPITIYGIFSVAQGWYFFPNSLLLKGKLLALTLPGMVSLLKHLVDNLVLAPHLLVLIAGCITIYLLGKKQRLFGEKEDHLFIIFTLMSFLHLDFASVGWFYRYEAYLVLTGGVIFIDIANQFIKKQPAIYLRTLNTSALLVLGILFVIPLIQRSAQAFIDYPTAVNNIYEQQYQMGLFLREFYSGKTVAANDIGAINYLADIKTLDLFGLGTMDVAIARRNGLYTKDVINKLVSRGNVEIVIIYKRWFDGNIPLGWLEVGSWQISNNIVNGDDKVSFYVPNSALEKEAITNLKNFSIVLPSTVKQSGIYITP
jgi:hypothetical protein